MKPEDLESLLLDRALGELPPTVAELFDEHLTRDALAAQQAAAFAATVQLARRAVAVPMADSLRPVATTRFRRAERQVRWRSRLGELAKLAACVALGLILGKSVWMPPPVADAGATQPAPGAVAAAEISRPASNFWSVTSLLAERRLQAARPQRRELGYSLIWPSPLKMPRVEEKP